VSIYILPLLLLLIGLIVGWLLRGRRVLSELKRLRMLHADSQFELEETRVASETRKREIESLKLEIQRNTQSATLKKPFSYQAVESQSNSTVDKTEHPLDERREGLRRASEREAADTAKELTQNQQSSENNGTLENEQSNNSPISEDTFFEESTSEGNSSEYFASDLTTFTDKQRLVDQEELITKLVEKTQQQEAEISQLREKDGWTNPKQQDSSNTENEDSLSDDFGKIEALTTVANKQKAFIQHQKQEQLKLKKTVVSLHKRFQEICQQQFCKSHCR